MDRALQEFTFELMRHAAEQGLSKVTVTEGNFSITVENTPVEAAAVAPTAAAPAAAPAAVQESAAQPEEESYSGTVVSAPLVGTFYAANAPEEPPIVSVGDTVTKGQTLCIIEAMKTMNTIESPCDGKVQKILVTNGELVEYHQPLIVIE
ncbi:MULTISPECIES: acetyl-CoA carboxylase biotin carboxyl carrier protein [Butyricicoccus]|mgnify:CR=1 FL=1|jgi:acetyl-CoA carboxylase biotin carboxyl carrier protein|uniref:Biotin carboxyl carrier protein of acetyl-CoA carboxylase n=1 Tax=Butyricicoccus intestinisimiae TaxID=2841509 RepID=A0ABS6EQQ9_9FIRM|nr:acetyl-CoA carboxylase biotin carboxyl carrier protein [Butyricicoccus intestinisimiae]MBU5489461.1 acetyl-CoA carboxylase biotin carboxyl carrier protein [Butyricicoccus intestinisimiae]